MEGPWVLLEPYWLMSKTPNILVLRSKRLEILETIFLILGSHVPACRLLKYVEMRPCRRFRSGTQTSYGGYTPCVSFWAFHVTLKRLKGFPWAFPRDFPRDVPWFSSPLHERLGILQHPGGIWDHHTIVLGARSQNIGERRINHEDNGLINMTNDI